MHETIVKWPVCAGRERLSMKAFNGECLSRCIVGERWVTVRPDRNRNKNRSLSLYIYAYIVFDQGLEKQAKMLDVSWQLA